MLPCGIRIGSSSQLGAGAWRFSAEEKLVSFEGLIFNHGRIPSHPCCESGEHCFCGDYDSGRLIIRDSLLQHFTEFVPHGPGSISIAAKVGVASAFAEMKRSFNMAGNEYSTQRRSFHDIHRPQEAGEIVHRRKRGAFVIFRGLAGLDLAGRGLAEPGQVEIQRQWLPLPRDERRLQPGRRDLKRALFPGGHDSVNLHEILNIPGYGKPFAQQRNGILDGAMVGFGRLSQFLDVQVAMLPLTKMKLVRSYLYAFIHPVETKVSHFVALLL